MNKTQQIIEDAFEADYAKFITDKSFSCEKARIRMLWDSAHDLGRDCGLAEVALKLMRGEYD